MKIILICISLLLPNLCAAKTDVLESAFNWLQNLSPKNIEFNVEKSTIKFNGCKQTEYSAVINQPLTNSTVLEMGLGYSKGQHSWGVFNQKISVKQFSFVPRYQLKHNMSVGMGVVIQSSSEFRSTQGLQFELPKNSEWLVNTRMQGLQSDHYWEVSIASQTWSGSQNVTTIFEKNVSNNKINLQYAGYF